MADSTSSNQIEFKNELNDDPVVSAYRMTGPKVNQGFFRVRRSELKKDKTLIPYSKHAQVVDFKPQEVLSREPDDQYPANPHVEQKIRHTLMQKEVRRNINRNKVTIDSLADGIEDVVSINDQAAHHILELVTNQLKKEGLWRDDDKDLTMTQAFPLSHTKADSRYRPNELRSLDNGTHLTEADLTHEDRAAERPASEFLTRSGVLRLPVLAEPMLNNLMRASPRDLYHQIARRMIEAQYFEDRPEDAQLYRACYFTSKGVEDEAHFDVLMKAGLASRMGHYTFEEFRVDRLALRKLIRSLMEQFFTHSPAILDRLELRDESDEKRDPKTVWSRFFEVWDGLTDKQQEALQAIYMEQDPMTYDAAAEKFGITRDSLVSRLKTAIQKFKAEFWEFDGMSPKKLAQRDLVGSYSFGGMWRDRAAAFRHELKKIDPKKIILMREAEWRTLPRSKNLDFKSEAHVKALVIENCPIPYFHETEYFDGMKPTIMSFGRRPGNLSEEDSPKRRSNEDENEI